MRKGRPGRPQPRRWNRGLPSIVQGWLVLRLGGAPAAGTEEVEIEVALVRAGRGNFSRNSSAYKADTAHLVTGLFERDPDFGATPERSPELRDGSFQCLDRGVSDSVRSASSSG